MEDIQCPRCKTTKYRNPSMKLMVNVCGHSLCENCVDLLFVRGSGSCVECGIPLRRSNFRLQLFEDPYVEKEVDIRKRILKDYNKKEEDFTNLRDYNDYLEEVEIIVFNLSNGIEMDETKKRIEQYKRENHDSIRKNMAKLSKDDEMLEDLIEQERVETEANRQEATATRLEEIRHKKKNKEALIDELMFSELPANHIMATHRSEVSAQKQQEQVTSSQQPRKNIMFSTGISLGQQEVILTGVPPKSEEQVFQYSALHFDYFGPAPPEEEIMDTQGYIDNIRSPSGRDRAGGYMAHIGCHRALQDAFCGLFFTSDDVGAGVAAAFHSAPRLPLTSH